MMASFCFVSVHCKPVVMTFIIIMEGLMTQIMNVISRTMSVNCQVSTCRCGNNTKDRKCLFADDDDDEVELVVVSVVQRQICCRWHWMPCLSVSAI